MPDHLVRILVVDPFRSSRLRTSSNLKSAGFIPDPVASGEHALYALGARHFHAAIVASQLPGIGADELCREIRRRANIPIIAISLWSQGDGVELLNAGADDHLGYPYEWEELLARVRALLRRTVGVLAPTRTVRLGSLVVRVNGDQARLDDEHDPLPPVQATVLAALCERAGALVAGIALRQRVAEIHGPDESEQLVAHVEHLAARLAAAGGPQLRPVAELGYVLGP